MDSIVDFIKAQRGRRGISQAELAGMAGVSRHTVSDLESGKLENIGSANLASILFSLGYELAVVPIRQAPKPFVKDGYNQAAERFEAKYGSNMIL